MVKEEGDSKLTGKACRMKEARVWNQGLQGSIVLEEVGEEDGLIRFWIGGRYEGFKPVGF